MNIWAKGVEGGVSGLTMIIWETLFRPTFSSTALKVRRKKLKRGGQLMMTIRRRLSKRLSNSRS